MTQREYETLRDSALARCERLESICPNTTEIVFAVTRDVRAAMVRDAGTTLTANTAGVYETFIGKRICIINEETDEPLFLPAVCDRAYYHGMVADDIILVEDNHLYVLRQTEPNPMFVDTNLTVTFNEATEPEPAVAFADVAAAVGVNTAITADDTDWLRQTAWGDWRTVTTAAGPYTTTATINDNPFVYHMADNGITLDALRRAIEETGSMFQKKAPKKPKEEELNAGDTKMLDDFLNSFMRSGA